MDKNMVSLPIGIDKPELPKEPDETKLPEKVSQMALSSPKERQQEEKVRN
jgi:hypothetical protein